MNTTVETTYDRHTLIKFARHHQLHNKTFIIYYPIIIFLLLDFTFHSLNTPAFFVNISILAFILLIIILYPYLNLRNHSNNLGVKNIIAFSENCINISSYCKTFKQATKYNYSSFLKVYERKNYIYLYISKNAAEIVDKNHITDGDIDMLKGLLKANISHENLHLLK